MAYSEISASMVSAGKAVVSTLTSLIRTNFIDHESRISDLESATILNGFIVGEVRIWSSSNLPTGFLWCDGSAVSRTTYADLYAVISTTYGVGDGSTTFNLPDARGRTPVGLDNMNNSVGTGGGDAGRMTSAGSGVDGDTIGAVGGSETHTLTTAQLAAHSHGVTDPGHVHSVADEGTFGGSNVLTAGVLIGSRNQVPSTGVAMSNTTGLTVNNEGSSSAHNNTQPSIVFPMIIRYLA